MSFTPTNDLERLLVKAAQDPAARPRFYQMLLEAQLYVLVPPNSGPHGERTLEASETVKLVNWKKGEQDLIPIFTSLPILQATIQQNGEPLDYLAMSGKDLFGMLGSGLIPAVLNPNCEAGKEFFVEEMRDLASGKFFEPAKREVVQRARQILLGQPAEYPHQLVEALKRHLISQPEVEAAYLAQISDPVSGVPPHVIIGIKMQGNVDAGMQPLVMIARETAGPDKIVDFTVIGHGGGVDDYFLKSTKPFFQRGVTAAGSGTAERKPFLKRLFGR